MLNSYYNHLVDDVKHHSDALLELCKASQDFKKTKNACELYTKYQADFTELAQCLCIRKEKSNDGSDAESIKEVAVAHQPCQELAHHSGMTSHSHAGCNVDAPSFIPSRKPKVNNDGSEIFTPQEWIDNGAEGPTHLNMWHAPPVLHAQYPWPHHYHLPTLHQSSSVYPGFQASGLPIPTFTPYPYYAGNVPLHTAAISNDELQGPRRNYKKKKARDVKKSRAHDASSADMNENHFEPLHGHIVSQSSRLQDIGTTQTNLDARSPPKSEDAFSGNRPVSKPDVLSPSKKDDISEEKPVPDLPCLMDEMVYLPERLRDFPALSSNMPTNKKPKVKFPRVKFQRKVKFTISDLFKTFNNTPDINQKTRADKNLASSYTFRSEKKPRASEENKCSCKHQVNLFPHSRPSFEKVPEDVHDCDEGEGWKTVKPRFNKNRGELTIKDNFKDNLAHNPCKLCEPSYRRHESSTETKDLNIGRNSHTPKGLDLDFKNLLVSPISPRSGKIINEVTASKNDHVSLADPQEVAVDTDTPNVGSGVHDDNSFPPLPTSVSSGSNDNEDELSICDDNTVNDTVPVVEDAHDMHEEFMKYLNYSTWPTQMDEIDKFESMIAGNNPSDPVLMYPSVSVEQFKEFILRHPSEAQAFRREITFKLRKIESTESKQQQAHEKRLELLKSRTDKVRGFVQKVKDVQLAQDRLALKRKHQIDEKLRKAEENRKNYLSIIRRKAHDEEEKLKEIAFINELEAQNRRHDSLALRQEHEERLQYLIDERHRRVEEKAAKEAAAEERRRIIEAERQQKLLKIAEARRIKEEEIDRKQQERENQRLETAREKAREREERLQARDAAQRATAEELQKRIQQKQEESARRHEENIESIRQRALEIGLHRNVDESINLSPVSKAEEPANIEFEKSPDNLENVKQKAIKKKRLRKIRSRLTTRGGEFIKNFAFVPSKQFSFGKALADVQALGSHCPPGESVHKLSALRDTLLKSQKNEPATFSNFAKSGGFLRLSEILKGLISTTGSLNSQDAQLISIIIDVYRVALVEGNSLRYIVLSNDIMLLVDILRFSVAGLGSNDKWIKVSETLLFTITSALNQELEVGEDNKTAICNLADICGYAINVGLVEKIVSVFQDVVIGTTSFIAIVPGCIEFFSAMLQKRYKSSDLMHTLTSTECFGAIPLLYEGLPKIGSGDDLPAYVIPIVDLLLKFAALDVYIFQDALGSEGIALQMRAIASNLINYSKAKSQNELLQSVLLLVGFFAIRNVKNQTLLQSGQQPTVLQQMVTLPIRYFCDQEYVDYLFPTLYVCSYGNLTNQAIVENDMSFSQLHDYVNSERGKVNLMMQVFHQMEQR